MLHKKRPHCEVLDEMTVAQTSSKMDLLNLSQTSDVDIATTRTDPFYIFLWAKADLTTHTMFWGSFHQLQGFVYHLL